MSFAPEQQSDVLPKRRLLVVYFAAIAITVIAIIIAWSLTPRRAAEHAQRAPAQISTIEQTSIRDTARGLDLRNAQREALGKWRWIDRDAGVGAIPIDVAIDLVVRDGGE